MIQSYLNNVEIICKDDIPLGIIPVPDIQPRFSCSEGLFSVHLKGVGGKPPYSWVITFGKMVILDEINSEILIQLNAYDAGPTVVCVAEGNEVRSQLRAYMLSGASILNTNLSPCAGKGRSYGGFHYNCNDQLIGGGGTVGNTGPYVPLSEVANDDGLILTDANYPLICQELESTDPLDSAQDCGLPYCGDAPFVACNSANLDEATGISDKGAGAFIAGSGFAAGMLNDVRTIAMKEDGCFPCKLHEGLDMVVLLTDSNGTSVPLVIHVDP